MKFIGCLYNYKVVHTDTLFSLLYKLINLELNGQVNILEEQPDVK